MVARAFLYSLLLGVPWERVQVPDPVGRYVMNQVLDRASALLATPGCGAVLTDFVDQEGRPLAEWLAGHDVDIQTHVSTILFFDDSRHRQCAGGALAFTVPGSRVVHVCVDRLKETWSRDRMYTVASIIHEVLHTLGLGENPPSPKQITARVLARCAR